MIMEKIKKQSTVPKSNLEERILPVGERSEWLSIAIYGRSGTGKTTFAGTAPKPLLVLDINDRGTISVKNQPETYVLAIEKWPEMEEVYWYLKNSDKFKTVVIDTATQWQDLALKEVTGEDETGLISRKSWGMISSLMKSWILNFRDLPMHKIFICQDRITGGEENEVDLEMITPEVGPALSPSVAKTLNAAVDVIGQTFIRERSITVKTKGGGEKQKTKVEYCLRIGPHARYLTKIRRSSPGTSLLSVLVDPTFEKIQKLIGGEDINEDE